MNEASAVLMLMAMIQAGTIPAAKPEVGIEYIGHSCFVIESPSGTRVTIDPFNSERWLGYRFPDSVKADAVLVTHPHYDHDATYYWGDSVPVFREPGEYRLADVNLRGVEGRHADPYGEDFGQTNTIWILETGGLRFVHLGDNGPLSEANVREIGSVDVLMIPVDGMDHILTTDQISAIREVLKPSITIPMHYRLEGFLDLPRSLGPIGPCLETQSGVTRLETNTTRLSRNTISQQVLAFHPSPDLGAWPERLASGWEKLGEARKLIDDNPAVTAKAVQLVREVYESFDCIVFAYQWAWLLNMSGKSKEAMHVLEQALAGAVMDDWEYRMRSRSLLGELYEKAGRGEDAARQYRIVIRNSHRRVLLEKAQKEVRR
jgi:L-ascorbate metabolism protein UlaG (beta-lactamase superfamily)